MKLWTEREISGLDNVDLLSKCSSLAQRADLVRYEVLCREGGVYLDTDMECLKNIDPLIEGLDFFGCWQKPSVISNAIFGGMPGHDIFLELKKRSRTDFQAQPWNAMGPPLFTRVVSSRPSARVFPRETFIPFTRAEYEWFPRWPMDITDPPPEAYAINHRSSVWYADSTKATLVGTPMDLLGARAILEKAEYWHYAFPFPWGTTVPTKPGWTERVAKRRRHFFVPLLEAHGGSLQGKTVLDLACCQGYWSFESKKAGASSVVGVDSSEAFVREAQAAARVLDIPDCSFVRAHLEDDCWWSRVGAPRDITLMLGVLYHLADPAYALRRAMQLTKETIILDGEVVPGEAPSFHMRARTPSEPTTLRSNVSSSFRTIPTTSALVWLLKDGGFRTIRILTPSPEMPQDYHAGTTVSIIATK